MFTFILIVDSSKKPEHAGDFLRGLGSVRQESDGRYLVEGKLGMEDGWIAISRNDNVIGDYEAHEIRKIKEKIGDPMYFLVEGRNTKSNFANDFLLKIDDSLNGLIDNDHGCIENINYFKKLNSKGVDWLQVPCP